MKILVRLFVVVLVMFSAVGIVSAELQGSAVTGSSYRVGAGDVLQIDVWREQDLKKQVIVTPDGEISLPLVGQLVAAGKTAAELSTAISDRLKKYIPDPVVTVTVISPNSNKIFIVGKVARPGEYRSAAYMDILQAISMAGGLTPFADDDDIKILRRMDGETRVFHFDYDEVISGDNLESNILLESGDTVVVP